MAKPRLLGISMMQRGLIVAAVLLAASHSVAAADCDAPKSNLQIVPPPAGVPKSAAAFSGRWQGDWPIVSKKQVLTQCARLYVAVTSAASVSVEQCTGSVKAANLKPECKYFVAQIDGDTMTFTDLNGGIYTFTMADVGGMLAEATTADHKSSTQFTKAP